MRSVLLTLMVFLTLVQFSSPCPASCIVCSEDAIICNKLSTIVEAPDSTKALMLTNGLIDTVSSIVFSSSSNMSVLSLSNNLISTIHYNAFQNLTALRTLMLDHNLISTQSLNTSTFSWLRQLETLHLGNNALRDINGPWFQNAGALRTLLLEGNLITSIDSSTFASSDLRNLEILDLSDNLVAYLGRNSFRSLPRLRSLDLSRNKLQNAPDAFSYLTWLSMLNLDYNRWNCTCQLRELASFLNSYVQSPDRVLYNGQRLACTSSDNPAVQTVLELTDANCVAANSNITVMVVAKGSITPRRYVRDIAVTAACSFLGGVGITLGIFALVYKSLGKRFRLLKDKNDAEERSSQASVQWEVSEGKEALSMACSLHNRNYRGHQPWAKDNNGDTMENQFICHNCSSTTLGTGYQEGGKRGGALLQAANHTGIQHNRRESWSAPEESDQWKETEDHAVLQSRIKDIRAQRHVEKGNVSPNRQRLHLRDQENVPRGGVSTDMATLRMQQLALRRHISVSQRQTFTPKDQIHQRTHGNHINNISILKQHHEEYSGLPVYQTINCLHCHQTYEYRQAEHENQDTLFINHNEGGLPGEKKVSETVLFRDSLNYNQSTTENQGREQRSVTFDLSGSLKNTVFVPDNKNNHDEAPYRFNKIKMSKAPDLKNNPKSGKTSTKLHNSSERKLRKTSKSHKPSTQLSRKLKVKLNLNPLRRNRIHSISSHEDIDADQTPVKGKKGRNQKSKKDKPSKKSGSKGRKAAKGSKNSEESDNENENEEEIKEEIKEEEEEEEDKSKNKSSKRKASKKNDEKPKRNNKKDDNDISNKQNDANVPANGENQADANANSSETQVNSGLDPSTAMAPNTDPNLPMGTMEATNDPQEVPEESSTASPTSTAPSVVQEYLSSGDGSPKRRIRLIIPEKPTSRPQTALEKKIR